MSWHKTLHYITKHPIPVPVYSAPHTPLTRGKSIKVIDIIYHFLKILYFYYIYIIELHLRPPLPRFYHNSILLHGILSFNDS